MCENWDVPHGRECGCYRFATARHRRFKGCGMIDGGELEIGFIVGLPKVGRGVSRRGSSKHHDSRQTLSPRSILSHPGDGVLICRFGRIDFEEGQDSATGVAAATVGVPGDVHGQGDRAAVR